MNAFLQKYNSRTLLNIGLLVFLLLLVSLIVFEPGKKPKPKAVHLTELSQADIKHIELQRIGKPDIKLEKRDSIWYLTEPYQLPANDFRAQSLTALAETKSYLQYDAKSVDLKKVRLDKPEVTIVLNDKLKLTIGGVDPIHNRRYVKNGDTLHLVNDTFYYQLTGTVTAFISYQILPPDAKLSKLVLPRFSLSQKDGEWYMRPAQKDTSADSINEFINEWRHAQSLQVSEYKGKLPKPDIRVYREATADPIDFSLQKKQGSTFLVRHDVKLSYKLSDETAEKLQQLPEPPSADDTADDESAAKDKK